MGKSRKIAQIVFLAVLTPPMASAAVFQEAKEPGPDTKVSEEIHEAIAALRNTNIENPKAWATAARKLTQIGKEAVPPLIEELEQTTADRPLRALGFTLRAIGDPRAVPALIRAIPRTLMPPGSDFGLRMDDPELLAFLRKHDLDKEDRDTGFSFGRAYREITGALHSITGQKFNEDELNFISLSGTPKQQWLQCWLFHGLAGRWTIWWKKNWRKFTDDPAYSKISLPLLPNAPEVAAISAEQPFPIGDQVHAAGGWANVIVGPPQASEHYRVFKDLDTGREIKWPKELPGPSEAKAEAIAEFAKDEGFDLRGVEYTPPGSTRSYYALQGYGLRAWQVDDSLYEKIEGDLRENKLPALTRPANDLLMDYDPKTKTYHPENKATFLFVTREGTTGILQLTGLGTELYRPEDFGQPMHAEPPALPGKITPLPTVRGVALGVQVRYNFLVEGDPEH